jgi:AraC-like DNA-binding protein
LTVDDAIKTIARLVPQLQNTSTMSISEGDEEVWLLRKRVQVADSGYRQVEISTLSWMIDVVRLGAGADWHPAKICLEAKSVSGLERLETFANTEVRFEHGMTGLAIPRSLLSRRIPTSGSSTAAAEVAEPSCEPPAAEFLVSLRQILRSFLTFGHPRIEMIAEIMGVNVRTLQRRLSEEGLTFKKVVDQARFQVAAELMGNPDVNLVEIASEVGYTDQAHFTRAFRRWAGVSPSEYRSHLRCD